MNETKEERICRRKIQIQADSIINMRNEQLRCNMQGTLYGNVQARLCTREKKKDENIRMLKIDLFSILTGK